MLTALVLAEWISEGLGFGGGVDAGGGRTEPPQGGRPNFVGEKVRLS